ncbi:MAG: glycosyltransferase family 1 protein [Sphingomonas sp.]|nr:glycosyltransferase family 1 protein [Sphingomonas sp.]
MSARPDSMGNAEPSGGSVKGLRIALFSGNYNCVRDGSNKALNKLVAFLLEQGASVRVYSPTSKRPAFTPSGNLVSVPSFPIPGRTEYRIAPGLPRAIEADIRAFRPTHFHLSAPDWLGFGAQRLARQLGLPVVTSMHTMFETYLEFYRLGFLSNWMKRRLRRFYSESDYVLVPNSALARRFADEGLGKVIGIWGRGVNHELFNPTRRSMDWRRTHGYGDDDIITLFFGRLVPEKGLETFWQTMDELGRRRTSAPPLIIGDGPGMARMKAALPNAVFAGHLEGSALGQAVASADILVNPSVTEAFGNVNLEGMSAGLAVVSANVDSATELIVGGQHGLLVDPRDPAAYADAIEQLMDDDALRARLGRQAHEESLRYVWPQVMSSVLDAYRATQRA